MAWASEFLRNGVKNKQNIIKELKGTNLGSHRIFNYIDDCLQNLLFSSKVLVESRFGISLKLLCSWSGLQKLFKNLYSVLTKADLKLSLHYLLLFWTTLSFLNLFHLFDKPYQSNPTFQKNAENLNHECVFFLNKIIFNITLPSSPTARNQLEIYQILVLLQLLSLKMHRFFWVFRVIRYLRMDFFVLMLSLIGAIVALSHYCFSTVFILLH